MISPRLQYQIFAEPIEPYVEPPTMDEWFRETAIPRFDKKRYQFQYPSFFPTTLLHEAPVPPMDSWFQESELPRWDRKRMQYLYDAYEFDPYPLPTAFFVNLDSYYREIVQPIFDVVRRQHEYPSLFYVTEIPTQHVASATSILIVKKDRLQYQMWAEPLNLQELAVLSIPTARPKILMSAVELKPRTVAWHLVPKADSTHVN